MREIPDTKLRNAIWWCVAREGMLVGKCGGNNFWWYTAASSGAVIRVPSFHLTGTKLFSRGRQTFVTMTPQDQFSSVARMRDCHRKPDFYGSKGAVEPKRATERLRSNWTLVVFGVSAINAMNKRDKREIRCFTIKSSYSQRLRLNNSSCLCRLYICNTCYAIFK